MGSVVSRAIKRHSAIGLTASKHAQLRELALRSTRARQFFIDAYWHPCHVRALMQQPKSLIEIHRDRGDLAREGLTVHQSEMAFKEALWTLRVSWGRSLQRVRRAIYQNPTIPETRKRWMYFVLRWPALLQMCLTDRTAHVDRDWARDLDERRLSSDLRRLVRRHRERRPRTGRKLWFEVDTNLYRTFRRDDDRTFRGAWLAITGLAKGQRICVPLAGASLGEFSPRTAKAKSLPTLHVEVGERVVFHIRERVTPFAPTGSREVGVDKGYSTLLTVSSGDAEKAFSYGSGADVLIDIVAEEAAMRNRERQRLKAYERSLRNSDRQKARRIRRRNLGDQKFRSASTKDRARLTSAIGAGLNAFFAAHRDVAVMNVESLHFTGSKFSRPMRMRLNRWLKGYLHRKLAYKAQLHGVQLNVVNAAWTSLTCPRCGYPSRDNRSGERFVCGACRYAGNADAVAATNILRRGSDRAITRYMRKDRVLQILEERWRSTPTGGAWDSNVDADGTSTTSREQLLLLSSPAFRSQNSQSPQ